MIFGAIYSLYSFSLSIYCSFISNFCSCSVLLSFLNRSYITSLSTYLPTYSELQRYIIIICICVCVRWFSLSSSFGTTFYKFHFNFFWHFISFLCQIYLWAEHIALAFSFHMLFVTMPHIIPIPPLQSITICWIIGTYIFNGTFFQPCSKYMHVSCIYNVSFS